MLVIRGRNVHEMLPEALWQLQQHGLERASRNGPVLLFPEPVTSVYEQPEERVLYWPERDANPFFHLMESIWMVAGRNDVKFLSQFVSRMVSYSDDGATFHGAYGYRWREHFRVDQLKSIISALTANPDDRRQVLQIWDARADLGGKGKDLPCNLGAHFQIACDGRLDMSVYNRSNDLVWGCYGANAVHFSFLHEFMARAIGVDTGIYRQVSDNLHAYLDPLRQVQDLKDFAPSAGGEPSSPYAVDTVHPFPILSTSLPAWEQDLQRFMADPEEVWFNDPFFRRVAKPMYAAHKAYKADRTESRFSNALEILEQCEATDWKLAAEQWINRRWKAFNKAQDDGANPTQNS